MQILLGILVALSGILLVLAIRSITTFVHEMGHAIPALLFTDEEVKVYVGTYGDISNGLNVIVGRFQIFLKFNPFDWKIGMCTHKGTESFWSTFLIILGGPIASLFISIPLLSKVTSTATSNEWKFIFMIIIVASLMDFLVNIVPSNRNIYMHDGSIGYNDGFQLKILLARKGMSEEHFELEKLIVAKKYDNAIEQCLANLNNNSDDRLSHRTLIEIYIDQKMYKEALSAYRKYENRFDMDHSENNELGQVLIHLKRYNEALPYFERVFDRSFQDPQLLYNIGIIKKEQGKYQESLKKLNGAIYYGLQKAEYFLARGQVSMLNGNYEDASKDLESAYSLDNNHPEVHYSIGKWHKQQGDSKKALECYVRAQDLGYKKESLAYEIEELR